ncbi:MAG TPA: hypothetical protein VGE13_02575 [Candidatus Saccharimonadales bacterium]
MSEIELRRHTEKTNAQFAFTLLRSEIEDSFQQIVDKRANIPGLRVHDVFEDYYQAPKQFGSIDKDSLMFYEMVALQFIRDKRISREFKTDAFELCASMLWEQAFIESIEDHNSIATVDDRLQLVDMGSEFLKHASSLAQKDDMERTERLLLISLFTQVMKDVVAGEVTQATKDELLIALRNAKSQLKFIPSNRARHGLQGELSVLESIWQDYNDIGDRVVLPSSVRGGSGRFRPDETHDITVLKQRKLDGSWRVLTPIEVKRQKITGAIKARYVRSHLAHVATDDTVSISGEHRKAAM